MSLLYKIARWAGHDTTVEVEDTRPLYEYTIEQTDGRTRKVHANGMIKEERMVRLYEYTEPFPVNIVTPNFWLLYDTVFEFGASTILSIQKEKLRNETWVATMDKADGEMLRWKKNE